MQNAGHLPGVVLRSALTQKSAGESVRAQSLVTSAVDPAICRVMTSSIATSTCLRYVGATGPVPRARDQIT
jgi:hypothetical protein